MIKRWLAIGRQGQQSDGQPSLDHVYRLIQYESFTRKLLSGVSLNRSPMSPPKLCVPSAPANPRRPWLHTTNIVDPGRYSQRNTTLERNCLKLNPTMLLVTGGSTNA